MLPDRFEAGKQLLVCLGGTGRQESIPLLQKRLELRVAVVLAALLDRWWKESSGLRKYVHINVPAAEKVWNRAPRIASLEGIEQGQFAIRNNQARQANVMLRKDRQLGIQSAFVMTLLL